MGLDVKNDRRFHPFLICGRTFVTHPEMDGHLKNSRTSGPRTVAEAKRERPENARPTNEAREQNKSVQLIVPIKTKDTTALTDHHRARALDLFP